MYTRFFKIVCSIFAFVFIISCDKDYNEIGSGLVADNHYDFLTKDDFTVNAYNRETGPVQTDNLETNFLGFYNNPTLANTEFDYACEMQLNELNPTIVNTNSPIQSVILNIPYTSTLSQINADGTRTYSLNNFIGTNSNPTNVSNRIKLSIFRTTFGITNVSVTPPFLNEPQRHYSNQFADFNSSVFGIRLNNFPTSIPASLTGIQNDNFVFSNEEVTNTDGITSAVTKTPPALKVDLSGSFGSFILNAGTTNLSSNEAFKQYIGNLLFKVDTYGTNTGSMAQLNFRAGTITIIYQDKAVITDTSNNTNRKIVLNLNGNGVGLQTNFAKVYNEPFLGTALTATSNQMFLKGGEGAMGVLNLFSGTELAQLRNPKVVINDATLVFKVKNSGADNPERIYLYDMDNQSPVYDYFIDQSTSTAYNQGKAVLGGFLETDAITGEKFYKVRITNYIRSLVNDPTLINVKIGVTVCKNIVNTRFGRISTISNFDITNWNNASILDNVAKNKYYYPETAVINPFGVVLHGTYPVGDINYNNRVKLVIKYSKPN